MKTKFITKVLVLLSIFTLSGCEYDTNFKFFNFTDTGSIYDSGKESDFSVIQVNDKLIWAAPDSEQTYSYELYKNNTVIEKTTDFSYNLSNENDKKGDKFYVIAKSTNGEQVTSKKTRIKRFESLPSKETADIFYTGWSNPDLKTIIGEYSIKGEENNAYPIYNNDKFTISKDINAISIECFEAGGLQFLFDQRKNPMTIYLKDVNIENRSVYTGSTFKYAGKDSDDVMFNFVIEGKNVVGNGVSENKNTGNDTMILPKVSFQGNGHLTVVGGHPATSSQSSDRLAINTNNIYNFMQAKNLKFVGGNGGDSNHYRLNGGNGQIPMKSDIIIKSSTTNSVCIQSGNGGNGYSTNHASQSTNGGDVYSYDYLVNKVYNNYKYLLADSGESPVPGAGGKGYSERYNGQPGKIITE